MKLFAFAASHRKDSVNRRLVRAAGDFAQGSGAALDFAEYGTFDMPIYDDETYRDQPMPVPAQKFVEHITSCDGILLASPEYNWSFPGSLKNIIDWASIVAPNPFAGKTALLLSASPSLRGGAQGLVHLKVPLEALGVFVFPRIFTLSRAEEFFAGEEDLSKTKIGNDLQQIVTDFMAMTGRLSTH